MPTFLLPDDPITSLDAYLATDIGGLGIERAQRIGPAATIEAVARLRAAGPGRRRLPDRAEVGRHRGAGRDPPLRRVQRRRGRAGHVQGPRAAARQPVPARRGRRSSPRSPSAPSEAFICLKAQLRARDRRGHPRRAGVPGGRHLHRLHGHHRRRARRVPVRRGEGDARGDRGQAAAAPLVPALRARPVRDRARSWAGRRRRATGVGRRPEPDARQQRRDAGQRARTSSPAAPTGSARWAPPSRPARSWPPSSATSSRPTSARSSSARRCARSSTPSAAASRRAGRSRRCSPASPTRSSPPTSSTCRSATRASARSAAAWAPPGSSSTTTPPAWSTPPTGCRGSCRRVVRPVPAVQARLGRDHRRTSSGSRPARGSDDDLAGSAHWLDRVTDGNRCYLAVEEQLVVGSILRAFPEEFAEHIELGRCPRPRRLPDPQARRPRRRRGHLRRDVLAQAARLDLRTRPAKS